MPDYPAQFKDVEVRRLLARAAELDSARGEGRSLADLRAIAVEAGIDASALEQALEEFAPEDEPSTRNWMPAVVALGAVFALFALGSRIAQSFEGSWAARGAIDLLALAGGAWLARRLGATRVALGVAVYGATQVALYVAHLVFGIRAAQGAGTQWAVIGAGVLAALVMGVWRRMVGSAGDSERRVPVREGEGSWWIWTSRLAQIN